MAFCEANSSLIRDQWAVVKFWRSQSKRAVDQKLAGSARQQVCSAHDFRYLRRCVVNNHRELISRNVIMPPDDEVTKILSSYKLLLTLVTVHKGNYFPIRNPKTPVDAPAQLSARAFFQTTRARINRFIFTSVRCAQCPQNVLPGARARIDMSACLQPLKCRLVK